MIRSDVIRTRGRRTALAVRTAAAAAVVLPLLLMTAPVGAQSSAAPGASSMPSIAPISTPSGSTIDPDSATGRLLALRDPLAADRALLVELRKDVPTTRDEATVFVDHVAQLALAADPATLGVIVSRVREAAPAWLDWRDGQYATPQEAAEAYARTGAAAFDASWESLHDAVLLTVANRLDTIIDLADRIEDGE